jgi:hypothetical protein
MSYWKGPFGILISDDIESILLMDGINKMFKDGTVTKLEVPERKYIRKENEYKWKYAIQKSDGDWYWKGKDYWKGPGNILIPKSRKIVPGLEFGTNMDYHGSIGGCQLYWLDLEHDGKKEKVTEKLTEVAYREKYAKYDNNNDIWYWDEEKYKSYLDTDT